MSGRMLVAACAIAALLVGCRGVSGVQPTEGPKTFDSATAYDYVKAQLDMGPRYPGSPGAAKLVEYITHELAKDGLKAETQDFVYDGPTLRNIVAKIGVGKGPIVIIGAHYDTRRYADSDLVDPGAPVPGADDGASGVAVLLELARVLDPDKLTNEVWLAFFDGEDQGNLGDWPWSVGAQYMADQLTIEPAYVVVVDMIGDMEQQIYYEESSNAQLQQHIWGIAASLGFQQHWIPTYKHSVIDDHIPFIERGIVAVDMIDLDYPYWHTQQDTLDKIDPAALGRVGQVLETLLEAQPFIVPPAS